MRRARPKAISAQLSESTGARPPNTVMHADGRFAPAGDYHVGQTGAQRYALVDPLLMSDSSP